ncbi:MAG: TonB-dependent receptor [Nitrospirae bacterium]|nr:TonB-dependent receptor [Nitrospirota bacterium]
MLTINRACRAAILALIIIAGLSAPSYARENTGDLTSLSLEALMDLPVYGASRFEQKASEAPSSVSIVTSDEIKKYGYRTIADILRSIRGFYVTYDRNYNYIGVRGFNRPGDYNTRILLLVDGHRMNDNLFNQASVGTDFPLDVDLIGRIEIIRGPGSSLYGDNAFFAIINIVTRGGSDLKGLEISGSLASHDTHSGGLNWGKRFSDDLNLILSSSVMDSKGRKRLFFQEFKDPAFNNGVAEDSDYDRSYSFFAKLSFNEITIEGAYASRKKGIPTAPFGTVFNEPGNQTTDIRGFMDLKFRHTFENRLEAAARVYYDYYNYHGDYVYDFADPLNPLQRLINKDIGEGRWWGGEVLLTRNLSERHRISAGIELRNNEKQLQHTYYESPYLNIFEDNRHSTIWSLYLQDEFHVSDKLILNGGVRYDHYKTFGGTTNPRLAMIYNPHANMTFKLLYGEAFRAPNAYELYYDAVEIGQKSNPGLKPEKIRTYELVYEQYHGKQFRSSVTGFIYKIDNLISQTIDSSDGLLFFENKEDVKARGVEFELEGQWTSGLRGKISYAFVKTEDLQTGEEMSNSPRHLAKLNILLPLLGDKIFLGLEEQYGSRRKTLSGDDAKAIYVTNVTLFAKNIIKSLEVSGSIYNLFDYTYGDPGAEEHLQDIIEQDGRSFRLKLAYAF